MQEIYALIYGHMDYTYSYFRHDRMYGTMVTAEELPRTHDISLNM